MSDGNESKWEPWHVIAIVLIGAIAAIIMQIIALPPKRPTCNEYSCGARFDDEQCICSPQEKPYRIDGTSIYYGWNTRWEKVK